MFDFVIFLSEIGILELNTQLKLFVYKTLSSFQYLVLMIFTEGSYLPFK